MTHMPKKRELIQAGALATDEQGSQVEILSNPWWDNRRFRILIRAYLGELTRLADLRTLSLDSNEEACTG